MPLIGRLQTGGAANMLQPLLHSCKPQLTAHAALRMQQRCIPMAAIELLLDHGDATPAGAGALRFQFTRVTWRRAAIALGSRSKQFEKYRNAYVVESSDGHIITAAWRI